MDDLRIQKYLSDCGVCSRRAAEKAIVEGRVTVNGIAAQTGMKIDPMRDTVRFDGKIIAKKRGSHYVYIMLNKPEGYLTTLHDDRDRKTVSELVKEVGVRVYPVGRLDMNSEGLLLLTNDGELTNKLTHPSHHVPKVYIVTLKTLVKPEKIAELAAICEIDGEKIEPVECVIEKYNQTTTSVRMTLYEGKNRQIRRMCEKVGLLVKRLKRVSLGELELDVQKGKWRYLERSEIDYLKSIG